jgi:acyl carrier protein
VLHGNPNRLNPRFLSGSHQKVNDREEKGKTSDVSRYAEEATRYFQSLLSSVIKLPPEKIAPREPLESYGIDSVMIMRLTSQLEKQFGPLSGTLFFEYRTIKELTDYFLESFPQRMVELLGLSQPPAESTQSRSAVQPTPVESLAPYRFRSPSAAISPPSEVSFPRSESVAVIGLAGRYPQAEDLETFWENLKNGKDCITEIPAERWPYASYFHPEKNKPGKTYTKWGGFLADIDRFDPLFFTISPKEAELMDPQERIFLECAFSTLEIAGYTREELGKPRRSRMSESMRRVGVFVGVMYEEYQLYGTETTHIGNPVAIAF